MAVRPAMPLAQLQGETAAVLDLQPLQDVRHDLERLVVGHQARVAVDVQKAHVLVAGDQRADVAAVLAGGKIRAAHGNKWHCRSEEHTSELQSLMRSSYAVFCLKKNNQPTTRMNDTK